MVCHIQTYKNKKNNKINRFEFGNNRTSSYNCTYAQLAQPDQTAFPNFSNLDFSAFLGIKYFFFIYPHHYIYIYSHVSIYHINLNILISNDAVNSRIFPCLHQIRVLQILCFNINCNFFFFTLCVYMLLYAHKVYDEMPVFVF